MGTTLIRSTPGSARPLPNLPGEPLSVQEALQYPIFKDHKNRLNNNPGSVWLRSYEAGETICRQGDYGSTAFYILSGDVELSIAASAPPAPKKSALIEAAKRLWGGAPGRRRRIPIDASQNLHHDTQQVKLGAGDIFGEMTCLSHLPRTGTVTALTSVQCLEMLPNILRALFENRPQTVWRNQRNKFERENLGQKFADPRPPDTLLQKVYRSRALIDDLRACSLLEGIPTASINPLIDAAEFSTFEPGENVFRQGDPSDEIFIVRRGFAKIAQADGDGEIVLNYMSKGQQFGEIGVLAAIDGRESGRTTSCSAIDDLELIVLTKTVIEGLLTQYPAVKQRLRKVATERAKPGRKKFVPDAPLDFQQYFDQGLMQGTNMLLFDLDRCTRCDECVRACADSHDGVTRLRREGLRFDKYLVPTSCRSCRDPLCLTECPVGSIGRSPTGAIIIEDWCIGCRRCEENCPYGNIEMHLFGVGETTKIYKNQEPVRRARVRFFPPSSFDVNGLPAELSYEPRGHWLELAEAQPEDLARFLAFSNDAGYVRAVTALMRQIQTRVPLPILPRDFKPPAEIEKVVKLRPAKAPETENAVIFRGVISDSTEPAYLSASTDASYRSAVHHASADTRGMKAVLSKAIVCDLCESVGQEPNCVYACPHDAAFRIDAAEVFQSKSGTH